MKPKATPGQIEKISPTGTQVKCSIKEENRSRYTNELWKGVNNRIGTVMAFKPADTMEDARCFVEFDFINKDGDPGNWWIPVVDLATL